MKLLIINLIESALLTWFISSLLIVKPNRKTLYWLLLGLSNFIIITVSNYIFVYDLFLTTYLIVINTFISSRFVKNDLAEILFVICLENNFLNVVNSMAIIINSKLTSIDAIALSKLLYFVCGYFVIRFIKKKHMYFNKQLYYILSAVLFGLHFLISHLVTIYITFEYQYPDLIISFVLFLICICGLFYVLLKLSDLYKTELSYNRLSQEKANEEVVAALYEQIRISKHDMKNMYQLLRHYIKEQNYDEINRMMDAKEEEVTEIPILIHTSNELINTIVNHKLIRAYAKHLDTQCKISVEKDIPVADYDLNDLLSNILDNAIENCVENGEITIQIKQNDQFLHICISNTIQNKTDFKTKKDPNYHGFGLKSVGRIVDKYNGVQEITQTDNIFTICISLPLLSL